MAQGQAGAVDTFGCKQAPLPIGHINQDTLAKMVGTTRSRINFFMNKFRRLGYIDYNGNIKVHPSLLNIVLRDGSSENRHDQ
jgi:CRP/FNR family cyclic AMP-dependent transcriptional regulator